MAARILAGNPPSLRRVGSFTSSSSPTCSRRLKHARPSSMLFSRRVLRLKKRGDGCFATHGTLAQIGEDRRLSERERIYLRFRPLPPFFCLRSLFRRLRSSFVSFRSSFLRLDRSSSSSFIR